MKKAVLVLSVLMGVFALFAQVPDLSPLREGVVTPQLESWIASGNSSNRQFSFNFDASPYNLPDSTDIQDPQTGLFLEDVAWTKDFSRHISNPESIPLTLSFLIPPTHFTVIQPDPENPLKLQFQPLPDNWFGSEILVLIASDAVPGGGTRTEAMAVIRLNVSSVLDPPVWSGLPDGNLFSTNEETSLQIDFQAYVDCVDSADPNNFDLYVTPADYPVDVTQEPGATGYLVTFAPQQNYNGTATYTVTAVDRLSNALSAREISIQVLGVNDPPVIDSYMPAELALNLDQGALQAFSATVQDVENDPLTHTWTHSGTLNGVPYSNVVGSSPSLDFTFSLPGIQTLQYQVTDGLATDEVTWTISVNPNGPEFNPAGGTYDHAIEVSISLPDGFSGATIYYTQDGSDPNSLSSVYTEPITLSTIPDQENSVTLKAFFQHPDYPASQIESQDYLITGQVADPQLSPAGGLYYVATEVSISCSNPQATIYYTTDGSEPVPGAPGTSVYLSPLTVPALATTTVKAFAARAGWLDSNIVTQVYQVTGTVQIAAHEMTPPPLPAGEFYLVEPGETVAVAIAGLTLDPASATLYYTLDNSLPGPENPNSLIYTPGQEISLANPTWVSLRAYLADWQPSNTYSYYYDVRTRTKLNLFGNGTAFDPVPGYSTVPVSVSISTSTNPAGAEVYYTTDGSDPTAATGTLYLSPILVSSTTTIKAMAQYPGLYPSNVYTGTYEITGIVDAPAFDPVPDSYDSPLNLTITTLLQETEIYYSLNGTDPSNTSPDSYLYAGPVPLGLGQHHVKAIAYKEFWDPSPITEGYYNIGILPAPVFDLASGVYYDPVIVHLSVPSVDDATIYYTTDGTEPSTFSLLYNPAAGIPIGLETSLTIKAIAWKTGWVTSAVSERSYQVTGTVATPNFLPGGGVYPTPTAVTISTTTIGATIRYTLDGQDPTETYGSTYSEPVTISSSATLKAKAFRTDWRASEIQGAVYTIFGNIADPVFTPGEGTYTTPIEVYISVNPPDATIFYTTDGSVPSESNGTIYAPGTPLNVSTDTLFRAAAFKTGWNPSAVVSAQYHITGTVSAPVFAPPSGQYATAQTVSLSVVPANATIVYTLDGTEPSLSNGTQYTEPLNVLVSTIVKAYAYLAGWNDSTVSTASYVINGPVGTPIISPAAGYYNATQTVSISSFPATATIRYTLDGSDPTLANGMTYTGPFSIDEHTIVKAYAYQNNWLDSAIANSEYFFVVGNPAFSLPSGIYADDQILELTVGTPGASIRYTTDGSSPTPDNGTLYMSPISIANSMTVKAIAYRSNWISSNIVSQTYVINGPVADPLFTIPGGSYYAEFNVGISTLPASATIYYTIDGSDPSQTNGTIYANPILIAANTVLKARAYQTNWLPSNISAAAYNMYCSPVTFVPPAGTYAANQNVSLSTVTTGATIVYTLDGSDPVPGVSPVFDPLNPIPVTENLTVKAMATRAGWYPSPVGSAAYVIDIPLPTVATPVILPNSGVFNTPQTVSMSTVTPDAIIWYTLDGSDPSPDNGNSYTGTFQVSQNVIIKARGYKAGHNPSGIATVQYVIVIPIETVATPTFNPAAGIYNNPVDVTISTQTPGASIRYTTDGTEPSDLIGEVYTGPVNIAQTSTVKAIAYKTGMNNSLISNASYVINIIIPEVAAPQFSMPSGTYQAEIDIAIATTTPEASIRYTTDGSLPSETNGALYSGPIHIGSDSTVFIQAIAYRAGWITSPVASASYIVTGTVANVGFTPAPGIYTQATSVVLTTPTIGASIRYTLDGSEPTENSALYSTAIVVPLNTTMVITARAFKPNWLPSEVIQNTYTVTGQVTITPPAFSLPGGTYNTPHSVTINTPIPADAVVRYTTDGSDPQTNSPVYEGPVLLPLNTTLTLKARAFKDDWIPSPLYSATYVMTGQVILPEILFDPLPGVYQTAQAIMVNPPTVPVDATLRYTLDGSEPSQNSPAYTTPINLSLNSSTTIKVKGFRNDWIPSLTTTGVFTITGQVAINAPVFTPAPGVYTSAQLITISSPAPADAAIRYTTDGTEPTELSQMYTTPINLPLDTALTLKVRAFKTDWMPSVTYTGVYTTTGSVSIALPVFTPNPGLYTSPQSVVVNTTTIPAGAVLHYTLDGSDPSEASPVYTTPISVGNGQSVTIRVRAYAPNWQPSAIHTGTFTVTGQVTIASPVFTPAAGTYQTAQVITLNTLTSPTGAILRYTMDGSEPTITSPTYVSAIPLGLNTLTTIKVKAFLTDWEPSPTYNATYNITGSVSIQAPVFSPPAGTYTTAQTITIGALTPSDAVVHYTTDGTDPTTSSAIYNGPVQLPLNTSLTLKVRAFKTDWLPSAIFSAAYNITGQVQLPATVFTPAGGVYQTAQTVTLSLPTLPLDATLRYTLDGSEPTLNSAAYSVPIQLALNSMTTIKAKGFRTDWIPSATVTATYTITGQVAFNTPVFSPAPGVYSTAQSITVSTPIPADAVVRYTTDGSDPTELSPQYTIPIALPLNTTLTLKVRAFKANWTPSAVQTGLYTTTGAVSIAQPVFTPQAGLYTEPQSIVINTVTIPAGGTVRYTLDGSDPNTSSPVYANPINIASGQTVTIRARAYLTNWNPSEIYSGTFSVTGQVSIAQPVFTPAAGTYQSSQLVIINTATTPAGATVRYTLDGSDPTPTSPTYTTPLTIAASTTVKARAYLTNWLPSVVYSAAYVITGQVSISTPVFTPAEGIYQTAQSVAINSATDPAGATIRYTTDGSTPTASSPVYASPIAVPLNTTMTVKAVAFLTGWTPSQVYSATYTVTGQVQLPATVFTPAAGTYQTAQSVTLNQNTAPSGATLRYTLDGTVPTENSPAYTAPINLALNTTTTISVKAFKANWTPSETATATYVITGQISFQTPVFTPEPGIYPSAQNVVISPTIPSDAIIRYTLDGSEPTQTSQAYTAPIPLALNTNTTIKVKAYKTDWTPSQTHTGVYTITGQAMIAEPVFTPEPGIYQTAQSVSINASVVPAGAQIRYTLDGSEPTVTSPLYTAPIPLGLNNNYQIRARAFATNWTPSQVYVGTYTITGTVAIPNPVFNPPAGLYQTAQNITLNTQTLPPGAVLRYTMFLPGIDPDENSPVYTGPIPLPLHTNTVIRVRAYKDDWTPSPVYEAAYTVTGQVDLMPPYLAPAPGVYTEPINVSSVGGTNPTGGVVRYTIDGSWPTEDSPVFDSPLEIGLNTIDLTITIRAFLDGWIPSLPRSGVYSVTGQVQMAETVFTPASGVYQTAQSVTLAAPTLPANAILRYTTDGSEPTINSATYTSPIPVPLSSTLTIKAKGFADGWIPSATESATYTVTGTVAQPVFSPPGGTYGAPVFVVMSTPTEGAEIRYTLDGSEPTPASELYTEPIEVPNFAINQRIVAVAYKADWTESTPTVGIYTILSSPINVRGFTYAGYIRVLWNLPGGSRALQGFNVYRRALGETQYVKINESLVNTQLDGNYYYDDYDTEMGFTYEYYVTAVYDGGESPASSPTVENYESQDLNISDASCAYPNPASASTTIKIILNRNDNVQIAVSIYDFAGKKIRTLTVPTTDSNLIEVPWDLTNSSGTKVGRGTYFARIIANDGVNRSEHVIKIAVK